MKILYTTCINGNKIDLKERKTANKYNIIIGFVNNTEVDSTRAVENNYDTLFFEGFSEAIEMIYTLNREMNNIEW